MLVTSKNVEVVLGIYLGTRPHADLKEAFDWEATTKGHKWWSRQRQGPLLTDEARAELATGLKKFGVTL
jgi:hypothetical protein